MRRILGSRKLAAVAVLMALADLTLRHGLSRLLVTAALVAALVVAVAIPRDIAHAAVSRVQDETETTDSAESITLTFTDSTPVDGNLLVSFMCMRIHAVVTHPSGWTEIVRQTGTGNQVVLSYLVAGASESNSYQWTWTGNARVALGASEYSGLTSSPLDVSASSSTGGSTVTSQTSGTTASVAQNETLAVAGMCIGGDDGSGDPSWDNSFTTIGTATSPGSTSQRATVTWAEFVDTDGGTEESTASWTTSRRASGAIAAFTEDLAGAPTSQGSAWWF